MMIVRGRRNKACPMSSITLRTGRGSMLFTISMRTCSFDSSVQGAQSRNTMLNSTHCSSSQAFDETSKTLRTVALPADTRMAMRTIRAKNWPIQRLTVSMP